MEKTIRFVLLLEIDNFFLYTARALAFLFLKYFVRRKDGWKENVLADLQVEILLFYRHL